MLTRQIVRGPASRAVGTRCSSSRIRTGTSVACSTSAAMLMPTRPLLSRVYRHFAPDDPFGERAGMDEAEFFETQMKDIDLEAVRRVSEERLTNEGIFPFSEEIATAQRIRKTLTAIHQAKSKGEDTSNSKDSSSSSNGSDKGEGVLPSSLSGLSEEERLVLQAQNMSDEERQVASTLPGGFAQWLSLSAKEQTRLRADYAYSERQRATKDHWAKKSYSSYEDYIRREIIGTTAEDLGCAGAGDAQTQQQQQQHGETPAEDPAAASGISSARGTPTSSSATADEVKSIIAEEGELAFEDDGEDDLTLLNPRETVPLPKLGTDASSAASSGADQFIGDADAMRAAIKQEQSEKTQNGATVSSEVEQEPLPRMYEQGPDAPPYPLPKTDPSKWGTEDIVTWLDCFAEEGIMDEEMIRTFRMARVDGDMLLNKVMPPNLFKIMRKWHLHRSNPRTRHLAEELVVEAEVVQYTIYLCFPYCGQIGST